MNGSRTMITRGSEQPHFAADPHFAAESIIFYRTLDVMSPRHCGENEMKLNSLWAVDIHDLFGMSVLRYCTSRALMVIQWGQTAVAHGEKSN